MPESGLEPETNDLEGRYTIQLCYSGFKLNLDNRIRTCMDLNPNQVPDRIRLYPEKLKQEDLFCILYPIYKAFFVLLNSSLKF